MKHLLAALLIAGTGVSAVGCAAHEQHRRGPAHPAYLHAMEDLRAARAHLARPTDNANTAWNEHVAIDEIDVALKDIREAAYEDGKDPDTVTGVDVRMDWSGRLHRSLELLRKARQDCEHFEANPEARGLQDGAVLHIEKAIHFVEEGIAANRY
jgi:hypothetical protein